MGRLMPTILMTVAMAGVLIACSEDDPASGDSAPVGQAAGPTTAGADAGADGSSDDSLGQGTVTVDGEPYAFGVFSCAVVGGTPNLGGDGDADVALGGTTLLVQVDGGTTYRVLDPEISLDGDTVVATGEGRDLAGSTSASVELTATCTRF